MPHFKFTNDLQDVIIDKVALAPIDRQYAVFRYLVNCFTQVDLVPEKSYVAVEANIIYVRFMLPGFLNTVFCPEVIL